ncbi:MAG: CoB--CoM heterodisulfide reductase iron-sulfur subunit A family protein [Pseudomonadota bacterium]
MADDNKNILVVGGGIAGISAALEAAEFGKNIILIERNPYLGGRVAQLHRYFPKLCPPNCGLEINYKRLKNNPRVIIRTQAEVTSVSGKEGNFEVKVKLQPRYVNDKCTCCGKCAEACDLEVDNPFNYNMSKMKAAFLPHPNAFPPKYVLHPDVAASDQAKKVQDSCEYCAIDLNEKEHEEKFKVGAIVWATGWEPFDPTKVEYYGFGKNKNVITNVMMERLASPDGPTGGKILRPSDGQPPKSVVFVQCAGSRDEKHLAYCSGVCCLASMKQATYVREQYPDSKATICFIDIRTPDRLEDFYTKVQQDEGISFIKSKIADISEDENTGELTLNGEDTIEGKRFSTKADLVVLATGIVPCKPIVDLKTDDYGFLVAEQLPGHHPAGCVMEPTEVSSTVQDGTAAALKAIQSIGAR